MDEEKNNGSAVRVGNEVIVGYPLELCPGMNVVLVTDKEGGKVFISAPVTNRTNIKQGPFILSGEVVEVEAGPNIRISSIHPNRLVIGADIAKETLRIVELEKRVENLEKALAGLIKQGKGTIKS